MWIGVGNGKKRNEKGAFSFHNCKNEIISYKTYTIKSASYNNKDQAPTTQEETLRDNNKSNENVLYSFAGMLSLGDEVHQKLEFSDFLKTKFAERTSP